MQAGIKIGLKEYQQRISQTQASVCEVYFRIDQKDRYHKLFDLLKTKGIKAGIHFWGHLKGNLLYNLASPVNYVREQTLSLIKETIDIAAQNQCYYVNVHPGNYCLVEMDLDRGCYGKISQFIPKEQGLQTLLENVDILHKYALNRKVLFLVETVSCLDNPFWYDEKTRLKPIDVGYVRVETLIVLASHGYFITNDLGHTLSDEISENREFLYQKLLEKTKQLAKQTKLIHPNTTKPPFNGTDTHNGLLDEDFKQNVLPTKKQLLEILKIFKKRNDVWLIPEPIKDHEKNYLELEKMVHFIENS